SWLPNGNQINPTVVPDGGASVPLSLAPDGRGGAFLASGYDLQARLTHFMDTGALAPGWSGDNGFYYFDGGYLPVVHVAVPDGDGGVFVISSDLVCFGHAHCAGNGTLLRAHHVDFDRSTAGWDREGIFLGSGDERNWDRRQAVSIASEPGSVI